MFLLGDVIKLVPMSALAGILMMTAWRMNEWTRIKIYFRRGFKSGISKYLITMFATIILDLTQAIIIGVLFAMVLFIARVSDMDINVAEVDVERLSDETGLIVKGKTAHIRVAYLTGPVYFATVAKLREYLFDFQKNGVLILSMRGVSLIDVSGLQFLDELYLELQLQGSRLLFSGLQPNVERMLQRSRVRDRLGDDSIYWSAEDAIKAASTMNR
jgi:SulP family sulfate permease